MSPSEATRESYLLSPRQLFDWLKGEPEQWGEDDVRRYFLPSEKPLGGGDLRRMRDGPPKRFSGSAGGGTVPAKKCLQMLRETTFQLRVESVRDLVVLALDGHEAINELYAFFVDVRAQLDEDSRGALVGSGAQLSWRRGDERRHVYGIVASCEETGPHRLRLEIAPRARLMGLSRGSTIHQGESVVSIVQKMLAQYHVASQWRLVKDYPRREYATQYEETDLAFALRLLAEEGIFFFFLHPEKDGPVDAALDVADAIAAVDQVSFDPRSGGVGTLDASHFAGLGREVMVMSDSAALYPAMSGTPEPISRLIQLGKQRLRQGLEEATSGIPGGAHLESLADRLVALLPGDEVPILPFEPHSGALNHSDDAVRILSRRRVVHSLQSTFQTYDPERPNLVLSASQRLSEDGGALHQLAAALRGIASEVPAAPEQLASAVDTLGRSVQGAMADGGHPLAGGMFHPPPLELYEHHGRHRRPDWEHDQHEPSRILEGATKGRDTASGESLCPWLLPGHRFALRDHEVDACNRRFVVTRVRHVASLVESSDGPSHYSNHFDVAPDEVPWVPEVPRRPNVQSCETATVVGHDAVSTNERGEIRVRFHWDRRGGSSATSCWLRMMQPWSGQGFGTQFIPRPGSEVVVSFQGGDPDRPLAIGCVYNAVCSPPFDLPARESVSGIHTRSVPSGHGHNELSFDDRDDQERVHLRAERRLEVKVGETRSLEVVGDDRTAVGGNRHVEVTGDAHLRVQGLRDARLAQDDELVVEGDARRTVYGASSEVVRGNASVEVVGAREVVVQGGAQQRVAGDFITRVSGSAVVAVGGDGASSSHVVHVEGTSRVHGSQSTEISSAGEVVIQCGSSAIILAPDRITLSSPEVVVQGTDSVVLAGDEVRAIAGSQLQGVADNILWKSSGAGLALGAEASLDGARVLLNSPSQGSDEIEERGSEATTIELVDQNGDPMPGQAFRVVKADGSVVAGKLDDAGRATVVLEADASIVFNGLNDVVPA